MRFAVVVVVLLRLSRWKVNMLMNKKFYILEASYFLKLSALSLPWLAWVLLVWFNGVSICKID